MHVYVAIVHCIATGSRARLVHQANLAVYRPPAVADAGGCAPATNTAIAATPHIRRVAAARGPCWCRCKGPQGSTLLCHQGFVAIVCFVCMHHTIVCTVRLLVSILPLSIYPIQSQSIDPSHSVRLVHSSPVSIHRLTCSLRLSLSQTALSGGPSILCSISHPTPRLLSYVYTTSVW